MNQKNDTWVVVLLALAGIGYAIHTGELQLPNAQDAESTPVASASYSSRDAFTALANQVGANHVSDTDDLLSLAEYAEKSRGLSGVKSEIESKCGIKPGSPKPLIADPAYGKEIAGKLRSMGGGL